MLPTLEYAARSCGRLLLEIREQGLTAEDKQEQLGAHFATQGDIRSQELGITLIRADYPDEVIVAEEQENDSVIPPNCTVFDPVDGTGNYYSGMRDFGVTFGTLRDGHPTCGTMYFPVDDVLISAVRGQGWFLNGRKMPKLRWDRPLDKTMVGTEIASWAVETMDTVLKPLAARFTVRSILSGIYGARAMVQQETGLYYNLNIAKIWDVAAGALIVEEAGMIACAPDGSTLTWDSIAMDWIYAANQKLAEIVLEHTRKWPGRKKK